MKCQTKTLRVPLGFGGTGNCKELWGIVALMKKMLESFFLLKTQVHNLRTINFPLTTFVLPKTYKEVGCLMVYFLNFKTSSRRTGN
jgi:hypothetical protein